MPAAEHDVDHDDRLKWTHSLSRAGQRARSILYLLVLAAVVVLGLLQVTVVVVPLILALILAAAISPLVSWLRRKGWSAGAATGTSFAALLIVFAALLLGVINAIRSEWGSLAGQAGERTQDLWTALKNSPLPVNDATLKHAQSSLQKLMGSSETQDQAMAGAALVSQMATGFVLMAVILFFFLKDGGRMWAFATQKLQGRQLAKTRVAGMRILAVLGGYVRGTAIVAAVDAVLIGAALVILQVPLALPLIVLIFLGAFIPILGATLTGILASVVALLGVGPVAAVIVVVVVVVVNQLEGNLLQPVVMGRTLQIHPLVVLLALATGGVIAGVLGAMLAVPVTAATWAALQVWAGVPSAGTPSRPAAPRQ